MITELEVTHTQTFDRRPLAILRNLPGNDVDMTPEQMRGLGLALLEAAYDCACMPMSKRKFLRTVRRYSTAETD